MQTIGITSILTGGLVFIAKAVINQYFKNRSEDFKHNLNLELEEAKSELSIQYAMASKLHDRRLNIIADFYQMIASLNNHTFDMTLELKVSHGNFEEEEIKRIKSATDSYNEFNNFFSINKISFMKLIESLRELFHESYNDYTFKRRWNVDNPQMTAQKAVNAFKIIKEKVLPILNQLELDFRKEIWLTVLTNSRIAD